jgi:SpoVK/Ycf46/Vps4 family AAA+-type ATPase
MFETPGWAMEMAEIFKSGTVSQFVIHGNVADWVPLQRDQWGFLVFTSLKEYLTKVMFDPFEVVIGYDRGRGIKVLKGTELFHQFLKVFDDFHRTSFAGVTRDEKAPEKILDTANFLPKEPKRALELIDRFIRNGLHRTKPGADGKPTPDPMRVAVILDYVQFLLPRAEPAYTNAEMVEVLIKVSDWASDPVINTAYVATCLLAENLTDLHRQIVENPRTAKIRIDLPGATEVKEYVAAITADIDDFSGICDVDRESLGQKLEGLSRIDIQNLVQRAVKNKRRISMEYLKTVKKELIEKSAGGRIEFVESKRTMDDVAGHKEAKIWMRQDALLMRKGRLKALPMGYLIAGRIGTGKTYLVECFAGEAGVPCVEIKNFREKWVGASEGNLEAIFKILHAMGQVVVFVDEADQVSGKRSGGDNDSGLSGRLYAMMAREMADTRNRGRIFWIFATSRPDLLEVDLKRVGRLDVHIPLFPPQNTEDRRDLFMALAKKNKLEIKPEEIPEFPDGLDDVGGNEMEGIIIRASRLYEVQDDGPDKRTIAQIVQEVVENYRPMAHSEKLELMDLVGVLECTDSRFLPGKYANLDLEKVKQRVDDLTMRL